MIETPPHRLDVARRVAERLKAAGTIAIATHVGGDGDGWGSACAIAHHYRPLGREVHLLAGSPYPDRFRFLLPRGVTPFDPGRAGFEALGSADVHLIVDTSEPSRLGEFVEFLDNARTVVVDHHAVSSGLVRSSLSFVDDQAAATAELVYDVLAQSGEPLGTDTARALYVGLVTDTGSFRYSNTSSHVHRLAADLLDAGVDPSAMYRELFARVTESEVGTLRSALERMERDPDYPITWTSLDADTVRRYGPLEDYEWITEHVRNMESTQIAAMFRDLGDGFVKVSLRSNGPADVARMARAVGGGGHVKAAGARVQGSLESVRERVLDVCRAALEAGTTASA